MTVRIIDAFFPAVKLFFAYTFAWIVFDMSSTWHTNLQHTRWLH